ncbi:hypothetical protein EIP86_005783 [Pleurotus ostreatoroseus]|nr:hypothetical protein EIP86_005783 [Pleurotus ostreatoroseus]
MLTPFQNDTEDNDEHNQTTEHQVTRADAAKAKRTRNKEKKAAAKLKDTVADNIKQLNELQELDERKQAAALAAQKAFLGYASYNTYDSHDGGHGPNLEPASCRTRPFNEQHCNALVKSFKTGKITFTQKECITIAVKAAWLDPDSLVQDIQDLRADSTIKWSDDAVNNTLRVYDGLHRLVANNKRCQNMRETSEAAQKYVEERQTTAFFNTVQDLSGLLTKEQQIGVQVFDMGLLLFSFTNSLVLMLNMIDVINQSPDKALIEEYLMSNHLPAKSLSLDDQLFALFTQLRSQPNADARKELLKIKKQQYRGAPTKAIFRAIFMDDQLRDALERLFEFPGFMNTAQLTTSLFSTWIDTRGVIGGVSFFSSP